MILLIEILNIKLKDVIYYYVNYIILLVAVLGTKLSRYNMLITQHY